MGDTLSAGLLPKRVMPGARAAAVPEDTTFIIRVVSVPGLAAPTVLRLRTSSTGPVSVALFDGIGNEIYRYPTFDVEEGGTYDAPLESDGLVPGTYTVLAVPNGRRATVRFPLVR